MDKYLKLLKAVEGMTTPTILKTLNQYVSKIPKASRYLEIGCYHGASLIGALLDNDVEAYAVDNFSEFNKSGKNEEILKKALKKYDMESRVEFFNIDCFEFFKMYEYTSPIGFYYYDGNHAEEPEYQGLIQGYPRVIPGGYIMIDDCFWSNVRIAVNRFIEDTGCQIVEEHIPELNANKRIDADWWNGVMILQKPS